MDDVDTGGGDITINVNTRKGTVETVKDAVKDVKKALADNYYKPKNLEPAVSASRAVEGAGMAEF